MSAEIIAALNDLRESVDRRTEQFRKMLYGILVLTAINLVVLIAVVTVVSTVKDVLEGSREARTQLIELAEYLVDCTTEGPNPPPKTGHDCYDRGIERTTGAILAIVDTNGDGVPDVKQLAESVGHPLPPPTTTVPKP